MNTGRGRGWRLICTVVVLGLEGIEVLQRDAIEVKNIERFRGRFDLVAATAVSPVEELAPAVEDLLRPQGYYCSVRPDEELGQPQKAGARLRLKETASWGLGVFCLYQIEK